MTILRLIRQHAFDPDEVAAMAAAFELALRDLGLADREDPATLIVARRIIELAKQGERDVERLRRGAVQSPPE